ncbi:PepSY domain-containing protein [Selenomonas sp. F0473]|uniref:PepSY domain-containing protein n=1 Tax=Selenomonas sp. F0473 TaxID=999423 RepID=UPI00029E4106|nr:PepSY domain-containing protein [Selenomonas sp. F0473]EKU72075.1 hypothetical protein HMPREF9161_00760 [Selenomonas sp. F0473]
MEMNDVKAKLANVFGAAHLKKIAAVAALCATVTAGGAYMHMQQAEAHNAAKAQARAEAVRAEASQRGVVLIDETQVRAIAAETIGKSESELSYWEIKLKSRDRDKHRSDRTQDGAFNPVYKVECHAGNMEYELRIDAVTGQVLSSKSEVDDDVF